MRMSSVFQLLPAVIVCVVALASNSELTAQDPSQPRIDPHLKSQTPYAFSNAAIKTNDGSANENSLDSCVLLTNGQLLQGYVISSETGYRIQMQNGAAITVPVAEIELHCKTINQVFEHLSRNVDLADVTQQIALCRWCVRHELFAEAELHLEYVKRLGADANIVKSLQQDLESRIEILNRPTHKVVSLETPSAKPADSGNNSEEVAKAASVLGSDADLKAAIESLSDTGFKYFASDIQSQLINGCSASGCHDNHARVMPLSFDQRGSPVTRRMTEHNLFQVLSFSNRVNPDGSPILEMAMTSHGESANSISKANAWQLNSRQFLYLRSWLHHIAERDSEGRLKVEAESQVSAETNNTDDLPVASNPESSARHPNVNPAAFNPVALPEPPAPVNPLKVDSFKAIDPFDPEIFNRQLRDQNMDIKNHPEKIDEESSLDQKTELPELPGLDGLDVPRAKDFSK